MNTDADCRGLRRAHQYFFLQKTFGIPESFFRNTINFLSYMNFLSQTALSLTDFVRRVKEGLMMIDLLELLCLASPQAANPPDGQDSDQMVFAL